MKKAVFFCLLAVIGSLVCDAQQQPNGTPPVPPNPNAAEIAFESDAIDYGTIKQGANGTVIFKFKNVGKEPLILSGVQASCGCTVPVAPVNKPFKPGESGTITVNYDTNKIGAFAKSITVSSNAKTSSKIITIKGKVEAVPVDETFPAKKAGGAPFENN